MLMLSSRYHTTYLHTCFFSSFFSLIKIIFKQSTLTPLDWIHVLHKFMFLLDYFRYQFFLWMSLWSCALDKANIVWDSLIQVGCLCETALSDICGTHQLKEKKQHLKLFWQHRSTHYLALNHTVLCQLFWLGFRILVLIQTFALA